jgi:hypothetical protein
MSTVFCAMAMEIATFANVNASEPAAFDLGQSNSAP